MCNKNVEVVFYKFYINPDFIIDDECFYVRSEIIDTGDNFFNKMRKDHEKFVQKRYFTKDKIEEMKNKLIDKIRQSENPFRVFCADFYHTDVEEDKIFEIYE